MVVCEFVQVHHRCHGSNALDMRQVVLRVCARVIIALSPKRCMNKPWYIQLCGLHVFPDSFKKSETMCLSSICCSHPTCQTVYMPY